MVAFRFFNFIMKSKTNAFHYFRKIGTNWTDNSSYYHCPITQDSNIGEVDLFYSGYYATYGYAHVISLEIWLDNNMRAGARQGRAGGVLDSTSHQHGYHILSHVD